MAKSGSQLWNEIAEAGFLSAVLRNPDAFYDINEAALTDKDFFCIEEKKVAKALWEVVGEKGKPDMASVIEALRSQNNGETVDYVSTLTTVPCSQDQAKEYGKTVKGLSVSRSIQAAGVKIIEIAGEKRGDYQSALLDAESALRRIQDTLPHVERSADPAEILRRMKSTAALNMTPISFSPTLHGLTGGFQPGHLWVIGGYSSTGKSAFACNIALDMMRNRGKKVAIISAEMTQDQYLIRMLAILSGVSQNNVRDRVTVGLEQHDALVAAERFLTRGQLRVYDTVYKMPAIRSEAKRLKEREGLDMLVIDFHQNIYVTGDEISDAREVALELQRLAKELEITVIDFSQLSNAMAQQDNEEKGGGEYYAFKGSGAIKDAADVALMLRRKRRDPMVSQLLKVQVAKNRHGPITDQDITCYMELATGKIYEIDEVDEE